ncbi:hypothetical protein BDA96_07G103200 [Sorghum bicolor]|uniref:Uncharacterized protein n=2 Tax=Sorghum bicolor TaxID=4558 RepID=A0A921UA29_SORBI|nr:hypothetical protein BDA96_07G103200 [Sorghum bicolor]OQU80220.1 hypothetical protein SORBI_3007G096833 [Sorghum bicolor]
MLFGSIYVCSLGALPTTTEPFTQQSWGRLEINPPFCNAKDKFKCSKLLLVKLMTTSVPLRIIVQIIKEVYCS